MSEATRTFIIKAEYDVPGSDKKGFVSLSSQFVLTSPDRARYKLGILNATWTYVEPFFESNVVGYGEFPQWRSVSQLFPL